MFLARKYNFCKSLLRNMSKSRQSERVAKQGWVIEIESDRTQRHALIPLISQISIMAQTAFVIF